MNKLHDDNKLTGKRKSQIGERSRMPATYGHSADRIVHLNAKDAKCGGNAVAAAIN